MLLTDYPTAVMTKNTANAYLATRLTFRNEVADLCEAHSGSATASGDRLWRFPHAQGAWPTSPGRGRMDADPCRESGPNTRSGLRFDRSLVGSESRERMPSRVGRVARVKKLIGSVIVMLGRLDETVVTNE